MFSSYNSFSKVTFDGIGSLLRLEQSNYDSILDECVEFVKGKDGFVVASIHDEYKFNGCASEDIAADVLTMAKDMPKAIFYILVMDNELTKIEAGRMASYIESALNGKDASTKGMTKKVKAAVEMVNYFIELMGIAVDDSEDESVSFSGDDCYSCGCSCECHNEFEDEESEDEESEDDESEDDEDDEDDEQEAYEDGYEDGYERGFDTGFSKGFDKGVNFSSPDGECDCSEAFMAGFDYAMELINDILADPDICPGDKVSVDVVDEDYGVDTSVEIEVYSDCDCDCECDEADCECDCCDESCDNHNDVEKEVDNDVCDGCPCFDECNKHTDKEDAAETEDDLIDKIFLEIDAMARLHKSHAMPHMVVVPFRFPFMF